jgi:hypothetical protein
MEYNSNIGGIIQKLVSSAKLARMIMAQISVQCFLILIEIPSVTARINVIDKVLFGYYSMVVYTCKKWGEPNILTPHAFWNIADFGEKCEKCEKINTITLVNGRLKKLV